MGLLDPVSTHSYSSVSPVTSASFDRQGFFFFYFLSLSWTENLRRVQNQSSGKASATVFFFLFFSFLLLVLLSLLFQESLVDFWFQKSRVTVVFHQTVYQTLRPVEAIWPRLRDIFTDFSSRHTVNVYLCSENSNHYFTHEFFLFGDFFIFSFFFFYIIIPQKVNCVFK